MVGIVKLMGVVMVVFSTIYLVKPAGMKKAMNYMLKEKRLYLGGVLSILIGIIFITAAADCDIPWLIVLMGILALVKGLAIFILGREKIILLAESLMKKPPKALRSLVVVKLALGILIISAA